jgi:hypothetical protein
VQVVVVDPLDVWWGLRLAAEGGAGGCNVVIFGGSHADLPLTETSGKALADVVVDRGISAVLVLDDLSMAAQRRVVADFGERLFERKSAAAHRTPVHVIIDEADAFAPQRVLPEGTRCAGVVDRMVRRGRSRGIGVTAISQRPAVLAKDILTQTEVLIALQVTGAAGPRRAAGVGEGERRRQAGGVPRQPRRPAARPGVGMEPEPAAGVRAHPGAQGADVRQQLHPEGRRERGRPSPRLRPVELDALRDQLATVLKEAEATDPVALRRRIAALERELAAKPAAAPMPTAEALTAARREGARRGCRRSPCSPRRSTRPSPR